MDPACLVALFAALAAYAVFATWRWHKASQAARVNQEKAQAFDDIMKHAPR